MRLPKEPSRLTDSELDGTNKYLTNVFKKAMAHPNNRAGFVNPPHPPADIMAQLNALVNARRQQQDAEIMDMLSSTSDDFSEDYDSDEPMPFEAPPMPPIDDETPPPSP